MTSSCILISRHDHVLSLSAFTSDPLSLLATTKVSAFSLTVSTLFLWLAYWNIPPWKCAWCHMYCPMQYWPRPSMEVSCQIHAPAALSPLPTGYETGRVPEPSQRVAGRKIPNHAGNGIRPSNPRPVTGLWERNGRFVIAQYVLKGWQTESGVGLRCEQCTD